MLMTPAVTQTWIWALTGGLVVLAIIAIGIWKAADWLRNQLTFFLTSFMQTDQFRNSVGTILTDARKTETFRHDVHAIIEESRDTAHFRDNVRASCRELSGAIATEVMRVHDTAPDSHSIYRKQVEAVFRSEIVLSMQAHNESPVAHHVALDNYVTRGELQGAVTRLEGKIDSFKEIVNNNQQHIITDLARIEMLVTKSRN